MIELADGIGMYQSSLRMHVDRICVRVGTAPDRKSALYALKENWRGSADDV